MIDKILKDIKGLFKVQDKVKFLKQNIPYLAFFYIGNIFSHHVRAYIGGDCYATIDLCQKCLTFLQCKSLYRWRYY